MSYELTFSDRQRRYLAYTLATELFCEDGSFVVAQDTEAFVVAPERPPVPPAARDPLLAEELSQKEAKDWARVRELFPPHAVADATRILEEARERAATLLLIAAPRAVTVERKLRGPAEVVARDNVPIDRTVIDFHRVRA